jgi:hypothetical protein
MCSKYIFILLAICFATTTNAQKPPSGRYTYAIAFAEWNGKSNGSSCTVIIKGDSITILQNAKSNLTGGKIIDKGIIVKHKATGQWIIAHKPADKYAKEVGGCSKGPSVIDFKHKKFWLC